MTNSIEIHEGDVVTLKSGGPRMTISRIFKTDRGNEVAICLWFVEGDVKKASIPVKALIVA